MPSRYQSDKKKIGDLLQSRLVAPDFQRTYSWERTIIETFWQDLKGFSDKYPNETFQREEYFLGSVVLVDVGTGPRQILDGQQRLATATILLAVLRDKFHALGEQRAADDIQTRLIGHFDTYTRAYHKNLEVNQYDRDFFAREIQEPTYIAGYIAATPTIISHHLIRNTASYFKEQVGLDLAGITGNDEKLRYVARVQKIITEHMSVVVVWSDDEDEAATVFETLNDRGIGLSAPDLVRNFVLKRADNTTREEINQNWGEVLAIEPDAAAEDFLRHYWLSRAGDVKARSLYREIKAYILANNVPSLDLSRDLSSEAGVYADILSANDDDPEMKMLLDGLSVLGAKSLLPPLLSAYKVGNLNDKRAFLSNLLTLYIRHVVIGGLEGSKLETFLYNLARRLRQDRNFATAKADIVRFAPTDTDFRATFLLASVNKASAARYLLREIEYNRRPTGDEVRINDLPSVNLEHVYPQNPTTGKWADHDQWIYRIGNLTLMSKRLNTAAKNADSPTKKPYYADSDLSITNELAAQTVWDQAAINGRQGRMAGDAMTVWSFV
jgi:uncharacterized protein with ParB-like and HNH nuclease domain